MAARAAPAASRGGYHGRAKPFAPPHPRLPCVRGAVMAEAMTEGLTAHPALRSANRAGIASPADARCAPLRWNRGPVRLPRPLRQCRLVLPPAGSFSPQKSSQNAPGAAAPGPPSGCAACIPRKGITRAVTLHRAVPSHTVCPFPAPRGPVESDNRYGYRTFL